MQLSHGFAVSRAYSLGFDALEAELFSFPLGYPKICAPSEPAVAKHTDWL